MVLEAGGRCQPSTKQILAKVHVTMIEVMDQYPHCTFRDLAKFPYFSKNTVDFKQQLRKKPTMTPCSGQD